jgi:membrane protease subunit HflC
MKARTLIPIIVVLVLLAALVLLSSAFVVNEMQLAIVTQFGAPKRAIMEPGLYFRVPFIQDVRYLPRQILRWESDPKELVTKDKTYIWVDAWALWRIVDPLAFYQALRTVDNGHGLLDDQIESATKDVVAAYDLIELVRSSDREMIYTLPELKESVDQDRKIDIGRKGMSETILNAASVVTRQTGETEDRKGSLEEVYGLRLIDVQINHVIYVEKVRKDVYARMRAERQRISQKYRSEGKEESSRILGEMDKELRTIESEGYKEAQRLRGEGKAQALTIYADAYGRDPQFYRFWKTLQTYENAIDKDTVLILSLDSPYFKVIADPALKDPGAD